MYRYRIYVGMYDKDTKQQEMSSTDILNTIRKVLRLNKIDNYTIYKGKGHYRSELQVVCEPTIVIEIIHNAIYLPVLCNELRKALNQESVMFTEEKIDSYIIKE